MQESEGVGEGERVYRGTELVLRNQNIESCTELSIHNFVFSWNGKPVGRIDGSEEDEEEGVEGGGGEGPNLIRHNERGKKTCQKIRYACEVGMRGMSGIGREGMRGMCDCNEGQPASVLF